jgi:hypothetical protein
VAPTATITTLSATTATVTTLVAPTATITNAIVAGIAALSTANVIGPLTIGLTSYTTTTSPSPLITIAGSYMKTSVGPVYAEDSWTIQNVIGSAGPNNTSNLAFTHVGADSTGDASVLMPNLTVSAGNVPFAGSLTPGDVVVARSASSGLIAFGTSATVTVGGLSYWSWDGTNMNLGAGGLALAAPYGFTSYGATIKGNCAISTQLNVGTASAAMTGGSGAVGDLSVARSADTGAIFFGSSATIAVGSGSYWYWDSAHMVLGTPYLELQGTGATLLLNTDASISRLSAGVIGIGNGTPGSTAGELVATNVQASWNGSLGVVSPGDMVAARSANTGVLYFGTGANAYWYFDGTNMNWSGGPLSAPGGTVGQTHAASSGTAISAIAVNGGIVTTFTVASDARLKTVKGSYARGLKELLSFTPRVFRWNEKGSEHTGLDTTTEHIGYIAQEVQAHMPETITGTETSKDGATEYLAFDKGPIYAAMHNAIRELNARIVALEAKLEAAEVRLGPTPVAK